MRRLILLALLGLLLAQAVVVLYALGRAGITSETRRLEQDARRARVQSLEATRDALAGDLEALRAREDNRLWYHYRALYLPPDLVATTLALVPSELTRRPEDPLVAYHFELRDGVLTSPALSGDEGSAYAAEVRQELARLATRTALLERELDAPAGEPTRELMDAFVCETNAAPGLKLQQLAEVEDASGQAQLKSEWDAYQSRVGKQSGSAARAQPQRSSQPVEVRVHALRWLSHGADRLGWPELVVATRRVEAGGQRWLQGFALDVRRLREAHLPALTRRVRAQAPRDRRDWRELDRELAAVEGSLPTVRLRSEPPPETVCVMPAGAAPPEQAAVRLAPPLERLALVDTAPPVDPRGLLAGTRTLLDGALGLAFVVVVLGGAIVTLAAWSERRLARQRADFVAALTHELKAPLTGFRALTELLHDGLVTDEAKKREYYASMLAESERLSRLVQNVLDASKLERGALQVVLEPLDPGPLLEDVVARFRPRLESEGFRFDVHVDADWPVLADREAFAHVVGNLLDNASKYGRGAELSIRLEGQTVVDHAGAWLQVVVADRGPGVPAAHRPRVFERFYRGDAPRQVGGAGLGLTIARALTQAMRGDLRLDEATDVGARFVLRLPLASPAQVPA